MDLVVQLVISDGINADHAIRQRNRWPGRLEQDALPANGRIHIFHLAERSPSPTG